VIDTTFMIAAMINGSPDPEDVRRYYRALKRRSATSISVPNSTRTITRTNFRALSRHDGYQALGPGERIVFETYSREAFEQSFNWIAQHEIFAEGRMGSGDYDKATVSFALAPPSDGEGHSHSGLRCQPTTFR